MLQISDNNIISIRKGDTGRLEVKLNIGTPLNPSYYILKGYDEAYFHVIEPRDLFENGIVQKTISLLNTSKNLNRKDLAFDINYAISQLPSPIDIPVDTESEEFEAMFTEAKAIQTTYLGLDGSRDIQYFVDISTANKFIARLLTLDPDLDIDILDKSTWNPFTEENTDSTYYVDFEILDTYDLDPGLYYYEVKLCKKDKYNQVSELITITPRTRFYIL